MAGKILEIILRARDEASAKFRTIGQSIQDTRSKAFSFDKGGGLGDINQGVQQLQKLAKTMVVLDIGTKAATAGVSLFSYATARARGDLKEAAEAGKRFEETMQAIPLIGQGWQLGRQIRELFTGEQGKQQKEDEKWTRYAEEGRRENEQLKERLRLTIEFKKTQRDESGEQTRLENEIYLLFAKKDEVELAKIQFDRDKQLNTVYERRAELMEKAIDMGKRRMTREQILAGENPMLYSDSNARYAVAEMDQQIDLIRATAERRSELAIQERKEKLLDMERETADQSRDIEFSIYQARLRWDKEDLQSQLANIQFATDKRIEAAKREFDEKRKQFPEDKARLDDEEKKRLRLLDLDNQWQTAQAKKDSKESAVKEIDANRLALLQQRAELGDKEAKKAAERLQIEKRFNDERVKYLALLKNTELTEKQRAEVNKQLADLDANKVKTLAKLGVGKAEPFRVAAAAESRFLLGNVAAYSEKGEPMIRVAKNTETMNKTLDSINKTQHEIAEHLRRNQVPQYQLVEK